MEVLNTFIHDIKIILPKTFEDNRGSFFENYNKKKFDEKINQKISFVQDNCSISNKNVLRGLHYQLPPFDQSKLISVQKGEIFDVAVDIRRSSSSFGKWVGYYLSEKNKKSIWIPKGFAHGFLVISPIAKVLYKTDNFYNKNSERSIIWNDSQLNINWPLKGLPIQSIKDKNANKFGESEIFE